MFTLQPGRIYPNKSSTYNGFRALLYKIQLIDWPIPQAGQVRKFNYCFI